jgi:hypothetical protein
MSASAATVELFRAQSDEEREEIYRFRYSVYVEEMGRYKRIADHDGRRLVEPEDAHSVLYGAREGSEVVGTSRLTLGRDGFSERQLSQYSLAPFLEEVPAALMAVGERMMVLPRLRGSPVGQRMRDLTQEDLEAAQVYLLFGNCEPHLLPLYLSAGACTYAEHNINSEEAGYLIPLLFSVAPAGELVRAIGKRDADGQPHLPRALARAFAGGHGVRSPASMAPEDYWAHVEQTLTRLDEQELHAFAGLDEAETRACVSRSTIIECAEGDRVLKEGGSSHNLFLVLGGTLEVRQGGRLVDVLRPGDVFGEMAFLLDLPRQFDVYAATADVQILSLSDGTLNALMAEEPAAAAKLLLNISRMLCGRLIKANGGSG